MKTLAKAYRLLTPKERKASWLVLILAAVVALFEVIGTMSVLPFLALVTDPTAVQKNKALMWAYEMSGSANNQEFLVYLGLVSFTLLSVSAFTRAAGQYAVYRFSQLRGFSIARRLMETYLRQPYPFYLSRHSGELSQKLLAETSILTNQVYQPLTTLVVQIIIVFALVLLLFVVNPIVALTALAVLGTCYALIFFGVRGILTQMGQRRISTNKERFRIASETFGGVKSLKLLGRERARLARFGSAARQMALIQAKAQTLGEVPRFAIEAVAFGGIILIAIVLLAQTGEDPSEAVKQVLPLLGLYVFVGYKIMPSLQKSYVALTQLRAGSPALDSIAADLEMIRDLPPLPEAPSAFLEFSDTIELDGVAFTHEGAPAPSLTEIAFSLPQGASVGIVGSTGAGKTTLMDVFLGLLTPGKGTISVDGVPVTTKNIRSWQAMIGYVPQDVFLIDGTVAENIGLGLTREEIDFAQVSKCAEMAQLADFVESQMEHGYDTMVGERGVRLSGGQRQRIGIARALYSNPEILVFDEATSALDTVTERAVMETISALTGVKTTMIVAHRIGTIRHCDEIIVLDKGQIVARGTYDELTAESRAFRSLVNAEAEPG